MMTRAGAAYFGDDEPVQLRRYSGRGGHAYPLSHDRELPTATTPYSIAREHHMSSYDTRSSIHASDQDANTRPRSRIPVACGRCRKRKIRCSGDLGNGLPCLNCKSAGNENCQFLRVSSHEAPIKGEPSQSTDFNNLETSSAAMRLQCRIVGPYGHHAYVQHTTPVTDGLYHRNSSLSGYQCPSVKYVAMPPFGYQEDNEYGLQGSYTALNSEQVLSSNYTMPSSTRAWTSTPQLSKNAPLYLEQQPACSHAQLPYHTYALRPTINPDMKTSSITGQQVLSTLPVPVNGNDRVLPFPANNRPPTGSSIRSSSGLAQGSYQSCDGLMTTHSKPVSSNAVSENTSLSSSYLPYSSSTPESLASTHAGCSSQNVSPQPNEIYGSNGEGLYANDSDDAAYGPSSQTPKRDSQSSNAEHEASMTNANLANGHTYIPYNSQSSYPAPPIDIIPAAPKSHHISTSIMSS